MFNLPKFFISFLASNIWKFQKNNLMWTCKLLYQLLKFLKLLWRQLAIGNLAFPALSHVLISNPNKELQSKIHFTSAHRTPMETKLMPSHTHFLLQMLAFFYQNPNHFVMLSRCIPLICSPPPPKKNDIKSFYS